MNFFVILWISSKLINIYVYFLRLCGYGFLDTLWKWTTAEFLKGKGYFNWSTLWKWEWVGHIQQVEQLKFINLLIFTSKSLDFYGF